MSAPVAPPTGGPVTTEAQALVFGPPSGEVKKIRLPSSDIAFVAPLGPPPTAPRRLVVAPSAHGCSAIVSSAKVGKGVPFSLRIGIWVAEGPLPVHSLTSSRGPEPGGDCR